MAVLNVKGVLNVCVCVCAWLVSLYGAETVCKLLQQPGQPHTRQTLLGKSSSGMAI